MFRQTRNSERGAVGESACSGKHGSVREMKGGGGLKGRILPLSENRNTGMAISI
jgi:hypothetical protein